MDPITNTNDGAEVTATPIVEGTTEATVDSEGTHPVAPVEAEVEATPVAPTTETPVEEVAADAVTPAEETTEIAA